MRRIRSCHEGLYSTKLQHGPALSAFIESEDDQYFTRSTGSAKLTPTAMVILLYLIGVAVAFVFGRQRRSAES
jgi:hypothetical protein